jgi:hypothetical protein
MRRPIVDGSTLLPGTYVTEGSDVIRLPEDE